MTAKEARGRAVAARFANASRHMTVRTIARRGSSQRITMSANTPPASRSPSAHSPAPKTQESTQSISETELAVLEYLRSRGYSNAEKALLQAIEDGPSEDKGKQPETLSSEELVKTLAVFAQAPSRPGENALKDSGTVISELTAMGNPSNIQNLIQSIASVGSEDILSNDHTDKQEGYKELEAWVEGSLDMYRVCL